MKLIKDGMVMIIADESTAKMYKNFGWQEVAEKKPVKIIEQVEIELTKKQLQEKLDELKIKYKPQENKSSLLAKLKKESPTDNFDDGLLKG